MMYMPKKEMKKQVICLTHALRYLDIHLSGTCSMHGHLAILIFAYATIKIGMV